MIDVNLYTIIVHTQLMHTRVHDMIDISKHNNMIARQPAIGGRETIRIIHIRMVEFPKMQPFYKLKAHKLTSFGSDFQGSCLCFERCHPLRIRA